MDNLGRDVRYAWRTLRRAPLAAATIVVTVGLGLGLVAAVYTIVNMLIFNVDEVRSPHELFGVERGVPAVEDPAIFTRAEYEHAEHGPGLDYANAHANRHVHSRQLVRARSACAWRSARAAAASGV